jgi:hypothetical protein
MERIYPDRMTIRSTMDIIPDSSPAASGSPLSKARPAILVIRATISSPNGTKDRGKRFFPEKYQLESAIVRKARTLSSL